ncbi:MAG: response regulator transcription factor [Acidimicrobiales bacterium]
MADVLIASDEEWVRGEVRSVLSGLDDVSVSEVTSGAAVLPAVRHSLPALAVVDLQMGNMGGMAVCLDLRLEESGGRIGHVPVLMLLDRRPDVFLARRAGAEGWVVKPFDPIRLRKAIVAVLGGGIYHDPSYLPHAVG